MFAFASSARVVVVSCAETFAYASNRTRNRASVVCAETRDGDDARVSLVVSLVARHVVAVAIIIIVIIIIIIIFIFPNDPSHVRLPMPTDETDRRTVARAPRASRLAPRARSSSPVARRSSSSVLGARRRT
jgi:amino acid transporter